MEKDVLTGGRGEEDRRARGREGKRLEKIGEERIVDDSYEERQGGRR